jgi:hypothetical protein
MALNAQYSNEDDDDEDDDSNEDDDDDCMPQQQSQKNTDTVGRLKLNLFEAYLTSFSTSIERACWCFYCC